MYLTNHLISNLITKINYGTNKRLRFLNIESNKMTLNLLAILYKNGVIRSYKLLNNNKVSIYFKYYSCNKVLKLSIVSKPGLRELWTLNKLTLNYNNNNFAGFYIMSTQKGILTSNLCLLRGFLGGEILLKVEI